MALQWRTLDFFKSEQVDNVWIKSCSLSCSAQNGLFLGTKDGTVVQVDQSWSRGISWQAYTERVHHIIISYDRVVTIGIDDGLCVLKIWDLKKMSNDSPNLIKAIVIQQAKIFPVTAIAVIESLCMITIGLENGVVLLLKSDQSNKNYKITVVYEDSTPITGLSIVFGTESFIYVVSYSRISIVPIGSSKEFPRTLDGGVGCEIGNSLLTPKEYPPEMVLARREAIYFYGRDGRGPCFIIGGEKTNVLWYRSYLVMVSVVPSLEEESNLTSPIPSLSPTATQLPFGSALHLGTVLSIYDLKTKLIAFRGTFGEEIFDPKCGQNVGEEIIKVLAGPSEIFVITITYKVFRLTEKDLETRLELLYSQNLYILAINMVSLSHSTVFHSREVDEKPTIAHDHSSQNSLEVVQEIHKRFADFLFSKAEYSSAVDHYIKTISYLSPSYVILKFMDPSHIIFLTRYLQAIYDSKIATSSHSSLLLNCYSKLKDEDKINQLVSQGSFDIENGIRICKTAGYFSQALELAKSAAMHDSVISILLDDIQDPSQVISYIAKLDSDAIEQTFQKYGSSLIKQLPKDSTDILVFLCTTEPQVHPENFISLYVNSKTWCIEFLERILSSRFNTSLGEYDSRYQNERERQSRATVCMTLLELYLENCQLSGDKKDTAWRSKALKLLKDDNGLDMDQALILCKRYNINEGILHIYERNSRYDDIIDYFNKHQDYKSLIQVCRENESNHPKFWIKALRFLIARPTENQDKILLVIKEIDRLNLLSTLEIIKLLSSNKEITLGLIKDFIIEKITMEKESLDKSFVETTKYQNEIEEMTRQIDSLKQSYFKAVAVNFVDKLLKSLRRIFSASIVIIRGQSQDECPRCSPERLILQDIMRSQHKAALDHSGFIKTLESSKDLFSYIVDCYSKNVFR